MCEIDLEWDHGVHDIYRGKLFLYMCYLTFCYETDLESEQLNPCYACCLIEVAICLNYFNIFDQ